MVKNPPATAGDAGDTDSLPGLGRSPREGHGNPLQYSYLEHPTDRRAWWATVQGVTVRNDTYTPHLRASALLFPVSDFCRAFHMLCPPLPGFRIYIFQGGLWQGHYLKWAHLFPSWSLLKHHLYLFIPSHLKLYIYYVPLPLECRLLEGWVICVCFPVVYPVPATEQACLIHSFSGSL